tara:strand:+ start:9407 stop:10429 length:1023 start_codon:yes stop_codon:yes gene_type:complete
MRFFFLKRGNEKLGSNRIFIENLSKWIDSLGYDVKVSTEIEKDYDVYILSKYSSLNDIIEIQKLDNKKLIGLVHPTDLSEKGKKMMNKCDFLIVGSLEEKDYYLNFHENIIRFPQIEDIKIINKVHTKKDQILIGYHGNLEHLEEMEGACEYALEKLSQEHNIKLIAIYDFSLGKWKKGRPKNIEIEDINWTSVDKMVLDLKKVDIGIVPGTNNFFLDQASTKKNLFYWMIKKFTGGNNNRINDYIIRFKTTSNAGRCFVFHQLGIPIVADFWPSHFEILGNSKCGMLAHSQNGWYQSLNKLIISAALRQEMSQNAHDTFIQKYDYTIWTKDLINQLKML